MGKEPHKPGDYGIAELVKKIEFNVLLIYISN